ncbi:sigma-70 family RNA polymerase sigma factor [Cytophagaceae bacterium ABcell3]|nr:sigma-70 family RNA polymerase sigma factor [Cytophagaceae bacterium ABcell3]
MQTIHQSKSAIAQERIWISRAQSNPEHFAPLYEKYYNPIFRFVYRRTNREELSADITSQVFLKAMMNIGKYEHRGLPFSAWLYRIASNEINMVVRAKKVQRYVSIEDAGLERMMEALEPEYDAERESLVIKSLNQLSTEEVQFLELRFFENKPFKEVGHIMKVTENNAKVKIYRIIGKIKKNIKLK